MSETDALADDTVASRGVAKNLNEDWFLPKHQGESYYSVLRSIQDDLKPNSYLEVGIRSGDSLVLAHCPSIGVDPRFIKPFHAELLDESGGFRKRFHMFETKSDKFFSEQDPLKILNCSHIDLFFLDGAHISDFLLRDIINSERLAATNSIIALHDCLPIDIAMTLPRQERAASPYPVVYQHYWAGDCWRVVLMLKKYRPEIKMDVIDSKPTGLVLLTGLDPASTVLSSRYDQIVAEMNALHLSEIGLRSYMDGLGVLPTAEFIGGEKLRRRFVPFAA